MFAAYRRDRHMNRWARADFIDSFPIIILGKLLMLCLKIPLYCNRISTSFISTPSVFMQNFVKKKNWLDFGLS